MKERIKELKRELESAHATIQNRTLQASPDPRPPSCMTTAHDPRTRHGGGALGAGIEWCADGARYA
jgi:hypothetical protein